MKHLYIIITVILGALIIFSCRKEQTYMEEIKQTTEEVHPELRDGEVIPDQYIVLYTNEVSGEITSKLKSEQEYEAITLEVSKITSDILSEQEIPKDVVINTFGPSVLGFTAKLSPNEVAKLRTNKNIKHIEPDRVISLKKSLSQIKGNQQPQSQQEPWGIRRVGRGDGTGKVVWILDSGVDPNHPDLTVDRSRSTAFLDGRKSGNSDDQYGHGTHIAGIIAAKDNAIGVVGIAAGATIVSVKVLDRLGRGQYSDVINAINYVSSKAKPGDVVNLSLNADTSFALENVIRNTADKGIYFTLAAGNNGDDGKYYSPGRMQYSHVFTVSAFDENDNWALFSNYGNPPIAYGAPGVAIYSTFKSGGYALMDGTSMAAPHLAGILLINNGVINTDGFVKNDIDGNPDPIAHK